MCIYNFVVSTEPNRMANHYPSDQQLIEALRQGDEQALTTIFNLYWKRLYFMALRRTGTHEAAEEIVQELFTELWDKRTHLFNGDRATLKLAPYLLTAVKNKILNLVRSRLQRKNYWEYYQKFLPEQENTTENQVEYNQLVNMIEKGIEQLPEKSKKVFRLNRLEGRSIEEIATQLNLSEKSIEYHLTKSLKVIRLYLKDYIVSFGFLLWTIIALS